MRILVLEDDFAWQRLLSEVTGGIVGITGFIVRGKGCLPVIDDIVREENPDLIIMAWKDFGAGVLDEIRSVSFRASRDPKIWVLTEYSPRAIHRSAEDADLVFQKREFPPGVLRLLLQHEVRSLELRREVRITQ